MTIYRDTLECGHHHLTEVLVPVDPQWRARRTLEGSSFCFRCPRRDGHLAIRRVVDVWLQVTPGAYDDLNGGIHIDAAELCVANGYEPTEENQDTLARAAFDPRIPALADLLRAGKITIVDQPKGQPADDVHEGP